VGGGFDQAEAREVILGAHQIWRCFFDVSAQEGWELRAVGGGLRVEGGRGGVEG